VKRLLIVAAWGFLCLPHMLHGQETADAPQNATDPAQTAGDSRWSLHFQATSIGQHHWSFPARYSGVNSLSDRPESRVSLTGTVFLSLRLTKYTELVVDPEIAGGEGFSGVTGIAGFTNGEMPRVATATPKLYPARMYLRQTWSLGGGTEAVADGANQTAGKVPARRISWTVGKFALSDFFDNNLYSGDPRTQFMNWAIMYNGAWDYAADTRGYTWGSIEEFASPHYSFRLASAMMPTFANGPHFDLRLRDNRSEVVEGERDYSLGGKKGALRLLGYANRADAGTYREALHLADGGTPELGPTRRDGTLKYGFGANLEQALTQDVGVFARYGWNDGKTESFVFTEIDRTIAGGVSAAGRRWRRPADHVGFGAVRNYLSGDHRSFLAAGGTGFLIGDGRLNYAPESIVEGYYGFNVGAGFTTTLDYQHVWNPAYNRDRGPVPVLSLRLHWER
jgi:high affinity Mn2+ porin